MVHDAESHADEDRRRREEVEVRNEADNAAYNAEKTLRDLGDKCPGRAQERGRDQDCGRARALGTDDVERMRTAKDALQQAMYKISEEIYAAGSGGNGAAPLAKKDSLPAPALATTTPSRVSSRKSRGVGEWKPLSMGALPSNPQVCP